VKLNFSFSPTFQVGAEVAFLLACNYFNGFPNRDSQPPPLEKQAGPGDLRKTIEMVTLLSLSHSTPTWKVGENGN
jgi:hypothetical protein